MVSSIVSVYMKKTARKKIKDPIALYPKQSYYAFDVFRLTFVQSKSTDPSMVSQTQPGSTYVNFRRESNTEFRMQ